MHLNKYVLIKVGWVKWEYRYLEFADNLSFNLNLFVLGVG